MLKIRFTSSYMLESIELISCPEKAITYLLPINSDRFLKLKTTMVWRCLSSDLETISGENPRNSRKKSAVYRSQGG